MKPLGIVVGGDALLRVTRPSRAEDAVWSAVEEARCAGWTARQMIAEVRSAWAEHLRREAAEDDRAFSRAAEVMS